MDYLEAKQVRDATEGNGIEAMLQGLLVIAKEVGAPDEVKARFEPRILEAADRFDAIKKALREMRTAVAGLTTGRLTADEQQLVTLLTQQLTSTECKPLRKRNKALEHLVKTLQSVKFQLEQASEENATLTHAIEAKDRMQRHIKLFASTQTITNTRHNELLGSKRITHDLEVAKLQEQHAQEVADLRKSLKKTLEDAVRAADVGHAEALRKATKEYREALPKG
jgi:molybdopterin converting factor small subunit